MRRQHATATGQGARLYDPHRDRVDLGDESAAIPLPDEIGAGLAQALDRAVHRSLAPRPGAAQIDADEAEPVDDDIGEAAVDDPRTAGLA